MISVYCYVEKAVWFQFNLKYVCIYTRSKKKSTGSRQAKFK